MLRLLVPCAILFMFSCTGNKPEETNTDTIPKKAIPNSVKSRDSSSKKSSSIAVNSNLTNWGNFIAGKTATAFNTKDSASWLLFKKTTDARWAALQKHIGNKIINWVNGHDLSSENEPLTLFYPFAGGDFYYANLFFPGQDTTIMVGLEPTGYVFDPDNLSNTELAEYFEDLGHTMFFPHRLGFFRTKSMAKDFKSGPLNGTVHTVMFYLSRFNYQIHYLEYFNLDKEGHEIKNAAVNAFTDTPRRMAYKIGYSEPGSKFVKEVIYFSYDASDGNMIRNPGLSKWLENRQQVVVFFKAASYLMHYSSFSVTRNYVLKHATRILQDDSGVPLKKLVQAGFDVQLYGKFTKTIKLFEKEFQPELKDAYASGKPDSLPFMIGYSVPLGECNLQAAIKKK